MKISLKDQSIKFLYAIPARNMDPATMKDHGIGMGLINIIIARAINAAHNPNKINITV